MLFLCGQPNILVIRTEKLKLASQIYYITMQKRKNCACMNFSLCIWGCTLPRPSIFGPHELVPIFGPHELVPIFGPYELVPIFGPYELITTFGPYESITIFGPHFRNIFSILFLIL